MDLQRRSFANVLGPLTTTWTQPKTCTYLLQPTNTQTATELYRGQKCVIPNADSATPSQSPTGLPQDITSCWPPVTRNAPIPIHPFYGWGIYSPGIACPSGYITACTAVYGDRKERSGGWSTAGMQFGLEPGETALGCCPAGYTCGEFVGIGTCTLVVSNTLTGSERVTLPTGQCEGTELVNTDAMATFPDVAEVIETVETTFTRSTIVTVTSLSEGLGGSLTGVAVRETSTDVFTAVTTIKGSLTRQVTLYAPMFQLYFQETDLPPGGLGGIGGNGTGSGGLEGGEEEEKGLSPGAIAGLVLGLVIGIVLLLGIGLFLVMRRRKLKEMEVRGNKDWKYLWATSSELPGQDQQHPYHIRGYNNNGGRTTPDLVSPYTGMSDPSPVDPYMYRSGRGRYFQYWPSVSSSLGQPPTELAADIEGATPVELYVPGMETILKEKRLPRVPRDDGVDVKVEGVVNESINTRVEVDRDRKDTLDSMRYA